MAAQSAAAAQGGAPGGKFQFYSRSPMREQSVPREPSAPRQEQQHPAAGGPVDLLETAGAPAAQPAEDAPKKKTSVFSKPRMGFSSKKKAGGKDGAAPDGKEGKDGNDGKKGRDGKDGEDGKGCGGADPAGAKPKKSSLFSSAAGKKPRDPNRSKEALAAADAGAAVAAQEVAVLASAGLEVGAVRAAVVAALVLPLHLGSFARQPREKRQSKSVALTQLSMPCPPPSAPEK